jgi:YD repeat-containing protein
VEEIAPVHSTVQWSYDIVNRLSSLIDALTPAGVTKCACDPAGNLTSMTDVDSHVTTFQYH